MNQLMKQNQILIGTSGYDYPEWRGAFYPETLRREDFLSWYATKFNAVELNFSFYRMPYAAQLSNMADRSGNKLLFSVKAHQSFTHQQFIQGTQQQFPIANWKDGAVAFSKAANPLLDKGLLASLLFQFPQSFHYTADNRRYLSDLLAQFKQFPLAVELRQSEWQRDSVRNGLLERGVLSVYTDEPTLPHIPQADKTMLEEENTQGIYMRFHGRNADAWYAKSTMAQKNNGSARYDYLYSTQELSDYVPVIHNKIEKGLKVQIYFNNHPKGSAAQNAQQLASMIFPKG